MGLRHWYFKKFPEWVEKHYLRVRRMGRLQFQGSAEPGWDASREGGAGEVWGWRVMARSRRLWTLALGAWPLPKGVRGRRTLKLVVGKSQLSSSAGPLLQDGSWLSG